MEQIIKVKPNQTLLDLVLQGCGTMEAGMLIAADNGLPLSYFPAADSVIVISGTSAAINNNVVLQYLQQHSIMIGTKAGALEGSLLITEDGGDDLTNEDGTDNLVSES